MDSQSSNAWLAQKIQEIRKDHPEQTIAVVAHQSEVKDGHLDSIVPKELSSSLEFRQDLNMSSAHWLYTPQRLLLVQKGKDKEGTDAEALGKSYRALGAVACQNLQAKKTSQVSILLSEMVASSGMVGIFENGFRLANYEQTYKRVEVDEKKEGGQDEDNDDRTKRVNKKVDSYSILCEKEELLKTEHAQFWRVCATSTEYTRFLGSTRGSVATPQWMEERVMEVVKDQQAVKEVRVLNSDKLQELGMNLFYNVGKGADSPPRCVIVHYQGDPSRGDEVDLAFVGKGVTYDTGGLNLKATGQMEDMYGDKCGACAVVGALKGTLELGTKKNIIFACGFAENAIGASVFKPGDIIKGMNGLSVEIGNTDAEGRLVLGDTFTYVQREFKPKRLIDLATLTGACMVALGLETAGLFSNDAALVEELKAASKDSFEAVWHMPIQDEHKNGIKGAYGDISNLGATRFGGACTAAAYLLRFVEGDTKWAHLDIAGPALRAGKPPVDMTGFGAALLLSFLKDKN